MNRKYIFIILLLDLIVASIIFISNKTFYIERSDTPRFINQIEVYRGNISLDKLPGLEKELTYYRELKPFYAIVGGLFKKINPINIILLLNIFFFVGLSFFSFLFLRLLYFSERLSLWGTIWIMSGYPILKYGLSLVTDISGWFFSVFAISLFLYGFSKNKNVFLFLTSLISFLGSLSKETGIMGLLFCLIYLLSTKLEFREKIKKLLIVSMPFLIMQIIFTFYLKNIGGPSFVDWWLYNYKIYFQDFYKIKYLITNEFLAIGAFGIFSLLGIYHYCLNRYQEKERSQIWGALLVSTMPIFFWPVFYYRIIYIQFLFFVPLALLGIIYIESLNSYKFKSNTLSLVLNFIMLTLPVAVNFLLFFLIKKL